MRFLLNNKNLEFDPQQYTSTTISKDNILNDELFICYLHFT